jgi:hypothetical protein
MADRYTVDGVAFDARGGLVDLMDTAEREHDVTLNPLKYADYPAACAHLAQRVADGTVYFGRAPLLIGDAVNASAAPIGNGWVWNRKVATPPTHLIAATAALWALDHNESGGVAVY